MGDLPDNIQQGRSEPMGAHVRDGGVNFAVFSEHAHAMELCLYDHSGQHERRRYALVGPHDGVFHGFLAGVGPGLVYGLRADGPYMPDQGHRFNPHKLLLDPYAREIIGQFEWRAEHHGYVIDHPDKAHSFDASDNGALALKARVAAPLQGISPRANAPHHACADVVLYEVHVKGFSQQHPEIPPSLRGSYAAMAHPAAVAYFKSLGVTTLSLLPIQYALDEPHLASRGLRNYWGYNTLGFFTPSARLACAATRADPSAVVTEFRDMVRELHCHGLEVVLDVVYNHTPEGNELGPTLSFRGLDNRSWYRLDTVDASCYENSSACGNTLNVAHPRVTQFVLDSLRYWVQDMGVDGFRFDLAPVLGRTQHGFDAQAAFFTALRQDPILAGVHLIAEPWDAGADGYQMGKFPGRFLEWNDQFRDVVRGYWLNKNVNDQRVGRGELARRFMASSDKFQHGQRSPTASVNFIAVHDGYTLADSTSFVRKHNEANGENNRDGRDGELSDNFGVEGPSADAEVLANRSKVRRAMLSTLLLAQGIPLLNGGDEFGNSQSGNNNAYCQDNPMGWLDWNHADQNQRAFVAQLLRLRCQEPLLRHSRWFCVPGQGAVGDATVQWLRPDGQEMRTSDWADTDVQLFAALMADAVEQTPRLALVFNPEPHTACMVLTHQEWSLVLDSSQELEPQCYPAGQVVLVPGRSLLLLRSSTLH